MFLSVYYEDVRACGACSIGELKVKSCSNVSWRFPMGMGKVHAFCDVAFLRWLIVG